ncbi:non-ribosomal peptide synthetase [Paenibacillus sp. GbtcB18]|uniref:non-ribosomal peptide synthetase n=1 Tax=Paenibacillus sp. GbtcB18 TaxID=2824763 RepID=UPI001C311BBA|nr:non-ribosomal peptide synthetase [Paenibacillus sp. GbtcB18]
MIAEVGQDVLKLDRIGIHDNFFALGGDSILSIQVKARLKARGYAITTRQLFEYQSIAELTEHAISVHESVSSEEAPASAPFDGLKPGDMERIDLELIEDAYPLSRLQAGMLFHSKWTSDSATFHDVFSFHIQGRYQAEAFREALRIVIHNHPILRTTVDYLNFSEPLQLVRKNIDLPLIELQLPSDPAEQEAALQAWSDEEKRQSFEWGQAPLYRVFIHERSTAAFQFTLSFHHAILDGWSVASMLTELFRVYDMQILTNADEQLQPSVPHNGQRVLYRDYVSAERLILNDPSCRLFWSKEMEDYAVTRLPDYTRDAQATEPAAPVAEQCQTYGISFTADLYRSLHQLATQNQVPLKTVLLALHVRAIAYLSGHSHLGIGMLTNGRLEEAGGEQTLGMFLNAVPLPIKLTGGSWNKLIRHIFDREKELLAYRRFPQSEIRELSGYSQLFEVLFNYNHFHVYRDIQNYQRVIEMNAFEQTDIPLLVQFSQHPSEVSGLQLEFYYHASRLTREQIITYADYYVELARLMCAEPDNRYEDAIPSRNAASRCPVDWLDTRQDWGESACLHQLFENQMLRTPDRTALINEDTRITYKELNDQADRIAHILISKGMRQDSVIGIYLPRSVHAVAAILGVWKAGGVYVPIDPAFPDERIRFLVEDSRAEWILTSGENMQRWMEVESVYRRLLDVEEAAGERRNEEAARIPERRRDARSSAYLIYTSGSTGHPKGVSGTHSNTLNRFRWMWDEYPFEQEELCCHKTPLSFVDSVWEIFGPLLQGCPVMILNEEYVRDTEKMIDALRQNRVTRLVLVPSLLSNILLSLKQRGASIESLKWCISSGELLTANVVEQFYQCIPEGRLINLYGSSEVGADVCYHEARKGDGHGIIGIPIANNRIHILDSFMQPVAIGAVGEIYVGGAGLALGYYYRPDLTAERFLPDPFGEVPGSRLFRTGDLARYLPDATIQFLGRADHQVKIRGVRIELQEIEWAISQLESIEQAVVDVTGSGEAKALAAYIRFTEGAPDKNTETVREVLKQSLPPYMVPAFIVELNQFPLTPSGKVWRKALPSPQQAKVSRNKVHREASTPTERRLLALWQDLFDLQQISVDDLFFDLGGNSLMATSLMTRIRFEFNADLPIRELYEQPTIEKLAEVIDGYVLNKADDEELKRLIEMIAELDEGEAEEIINDTDRINQLIHNNRMSV